MTAPDAFVKTKNENGLHVSTINLDAATKGMEANSPLVIWFSEVINQDGNGVPLWSIVGIVVLTLLILWVLSN